MPVALSAVSQRFEEIGNESRAYSCYRTACLPVSAALALSGAACGAQLKSLTVCADPGNMPLSNQKGEGFENKIAQVIGKALWEPACSITGVPRSSAASCAPP